MENIPFLSFDRSNHAHKDELMQAFQAFLDRKWYILGNSVASFEAQYAQWNECAYAVGVSNGLDALRLSLDLLGIGPGDEVIVPSNAYIATVLAVSQVGATPVFAEPRLSTFNMDPECIEHVISAKTKAIMPVHLYGQACEMEALMKIAERHGLYVIEDNAQAHGARYKGKRTGSFGHINATSFYPTKNLGALGDAGAITTNNETWAEKARVMRNYGSSKKYYNEIIGYNMRLDECQAALLSVKLKYLDEWNTERQKIAAWYASYLADVQEVILPELAPEATSVFHLYVIRCRQRDALQKHLADKGIGSIVHYPVPPHLQPAYHQLGYKRGDFPIAEAIADTCLSLPIYPGLAEPQVAFIAAAVRSFLG